MSITKQYAIVSQALILLAVLIGTCIRMPVFMDDWYVWGDIACAILISSSVVLITQGLERSVAIAVAIVMGGALPDALFFIVYLFQVNDAVVLLLAILCGIIYYRSASGPKLLTANTVALAAIIPIKLFAQHSVAFVNETSAFPTLQHITGSDLKHMGEESVYVVVMAFVYMLFAIVIARLLYREYIFVPGLLFLAAVGHLWDKVNGEPFLVAGNQALMLICSVVFLTVLEVIRYYNRQRSLK